MGIGDRRTRSTGRFAHKGMVKRVYEGRWSWSPYMQKLSESIEIDGVTYIRYLPIKPDEGSIQGIFCDKFGNISCDAGPGDTDAQAVAPTASGSGGYVFGQVGETRRKDKAHKRNIQVPGVMVDGIVPEQRQTHALSGVYAPCLAGLPGVVIHADMELDGTTSPSGARANFARTAAGEVQTGQSVNFGHGIPVRFSTILAQQDRLADIWATVERGNHNGRLFDGAGKVNVSLLGSNVVDSGSFLDVSQEAKTVVFYGTFQTSWLKVEARKQILAITQPGRITQFVEKVREVTFSGRAAAQQQKPVLCLKERVVFQLTDEGLELIEIAPTVDLKANILDRMNFQPRISDGLALIASHGLQKDTAETEKGSPISKAVSGVKNV
ncbi:MAG: CoA-transferase [Roseobacter sp.]